ncbi:hypothetical protein PHMEG_00016854 [Phytophthora megakarya]|uniref:Uncharacterized protein n=1 Tax=Phytophthora megakarya TaxID=4795 RepID=A0A225VY83_9STRA|nr:hypothetical protein PHMEG_00016854 [Phytophthora megakarya]
MASLSSDKEPLALSELLSDFEVKQRGLLLMAIDKAVDKAMKKQGEMLDGIRTQVEARHRHAVDELRDEMTRTAPSIMDQVISKTLSVENNAGLVNWITEESTKNQALEYIFKLRSHLESGQGNAFRSDFEALLVVYMEFLQIPMLRGNRLNNRIEDFHEALYIKADYNDDLVNLVYRLPLPLNAESPLMRGSQLPAAFAVKQVDVPTQANLALVPSFVWYHDRPTELPKESDRVRKAMFARMLNHMDELPKATLCPLQADHDPTCPLSHTYIEVMTYNPLYKRLICRQPSHYWGSQIQEDDSCVCIHVDTGVTWEWMDEARDKRMYCLRGAKCTNSKCIKSHSFEEMCWYNPSYKIKRCTVRAHDHIARARGTIAPPLDCSYYHIEEGKNADKREFTAEYDHVGKDIKMLFIERSHKPLADRLEALRFARLNSN